MVQSVFKNSIPLAGESLGQAQVCHITGGEQQRSWITGECGELFLEGMVCAGVAIDQMSGTAAGAIAFYAFDECGFDFGVIGQTEIVIAAKTDKLPVIDDHLGLLRPVTDPACTIKVLRLAVF